MIEWISTANGLRRHLALACSALLIAGCKQERTVTIQPSQRSSGSEFQNRALDPSEIVVLPIDGNTPLDEKIREAQKRVRSGTNSDVSLNRLGWLFVHKARVSFDTGYYKLAEQCAICLERKRPGSPEAALLRGHVLQNLHRFKEAEPLARDLARTRGLAADFGLLGDVLMEQGRIDDAVIAYQRMADLKPDLQAMARAGHMRWLKGDLDGAIEMMRSAAQAASPHDAESAAWVNSRLAMYLLQGEDFSGAQQACQSALAFQTQYPPALLAKGRILLAQDKAKEALEPLRQGAAINPLPEYLWAFSEALRSAGERKEAAEVELKLKAHGAAADPRTFSLFLATRGENPGTALRLANSELEARQDIFTWDAIAWSLAAQHRWPEAAQKMERALAEGTQDARLLLHAGVIAAEVGRETDRDRLLGQANAIRQMLLPSERSLLACYLGKSVAHAGSPDSSELTRHD